PEAGGVPPQRHRPRGRDRPGDGVRLRDRARHGDVRVLGGAARRGARHDRGAGAAPGEPAGRGRVLHDRRGVRRGEGGGDRPAQPRGARGRAGLGRTPLHRHARQGRPRGAGDHQEPAARAARGGVRGGPAPDGRPVGRAVHLRRGPGGHRRLHGEAPAALGAVLRIANCSGFYGDRLSAAREMVEGGPIDVLTGDWLAELTMLILAGNRLKGRPGYAPTFLRQLEDVLGTCLERGIRIVSNAGGLDPAGCADAVRELAGRLGLSPRVAHVSGDDLTGRELDLVNADTGERLTAAPLTANAYLGGRPIAAALAAGADVVVTGRVTDAALVTGPGIWRYGWTPDDLDPLAGSVVAGHVIECGCQATGGNYAFFQDVPDLAHCGFPIAELHADGSSVLTKHPGTGGLVSVGTVTAQLLYEIAGPCYPGPDVVARFDTISLAPDGPDRVRISGVRGEPPPDTLKVAVNYLAGYRNTMTLVLTGLDIEEKARVAEEAIWARVPKDSFDEVDVTLTEHGLLRITVMDADRERAGRAFSSAVVETGLANYPGFYGLTPPGPASPYGVYWPVLVPTSEVRPEVYVDG